MRNLSFIERVFETPAVAQLWLRPPGCSIVAPEKRSKTTGWLENQAASSQDKETVSAWPYGCAVTVLFTKALLQKDPRPDQREAALREADTLESPPLDRFFLLERPTQWRCGTRWGAHSSSSVPHGRLCRASSPTKCRTNCRCCAMARDIGFALTILESRRPTPPTLAVLGELDSDAKSLVQSWNCLERDSGRRRAV